MQDIHGIGEGGGGGGGRRFIGAGDRRLRPLNHLAVKCPRCDSLNTKFCYYNNYNLSQPRHFCKSCRRYWTKGGVLRNVPVGGGCRKTKRSKPKCNASSADDAPGDTKPSAQSSSSESSNLTITTTAGPPTSEEGPVPIYKTANSAVVYNFGDVNPQANPDLDRQALDNHPPSDRQIFSREIGGFTGLMTSSEMMMELDAATTSYPSGKVDELKAEDMSKDELAAELEWGSGGAGELFDLTAGVDSAYWSQSDWTDNDQSLNYLP